MNPIEMTICQCGEIVEHIDDNYINAEERYNITDNNKTNRYHIGIQLLICPKCSLEQLHTR